MARTDVGAQLTRQHKQAQLAVRARGLRDFVRIWPLWEGDSSSFDHLVAAALPLVRVHHRVSAVLAVTYYDAFRRAERAGGSPAPRLIETIDADKVALSLHVTGRVMTRKALAGGASPEDARRVALIRTSGAIARHILAGGRDTLVASARADTRAGGYGRVLSPGSCSFCRDLAAQGAVNDDFRAHDHCGCIAEPAYT